MSLTIRQQTALAVCALASLFVGYATAGDHDHSTGCSCSICAGGLHVIPLPSEGVALGSGFYSYDVAEPAPSASSPSVPVFNSLPGAHAKLFLDFDGVDFGTTKWANKYPGQRPAFDVDNNTSTFSADELSRIEQVWSRVAESYSMFNINVTTEDPGNYNRAETAHIVISGSSSWYGQLAGGVAYVSAFTSHSTPAMVRRTGWVFPEHLRVSSHGDPKTVADAAIHEAGHMFGLNHQGTFNSSGTRIENYDNNNGSALSAPNLGVAYSARRGLWSIGATSSAYSQVDELARIGASSNGFGFVDDEVGVSFVTAPVLDPSTDPLRGVIATSDDVDYYKFDLDHQSNVSLLIDVAPYGPTLDARLFLYDADYALLADDDPVLNTSRASLTASFDGVLEAGTYYLGVGSHGGYTYQNGPATRFLQDVGQYFLTGSIVSVPEPTAAALLLLTLAAAACPATRRTS